MYSELQNRLVEGYVLRKRYKIIKLISNNNGFGITYLAEDLDLPNNHKCVVKQLDLQKFSNFSSTLANKVTELFQREAESLYRLGKHPQIPRLFARFNENEEFYLVQEYIDGDSLCSEIDPTKLWSEAQTIKFLKEILEILAFVHQNSSIHRDIKPSNIMRRKYDKKMFLIDFGAVKNIHTTVNLPQVRNEKYLSPTIIGTPPYASPEQMCNDNPKTVYANDIFAIGIIAIEGLTGSTNHNGWHSKNIGISDNLVEIITNMVHEKCERRYQNAQEALTAINRTLVFPPLSSKLQNHTFSEKFWTWFHNG